MHWNSIRKYWQIIIARLNSNTQQPDAEQIRLISLHREWLATPMAASIKEMLTVFASNCSNVAASQSVKDGVSDSIVRMNCAQLFAYNKVKDTLYDTEKFVQHFKRP